MPVVVLMAVMWSGCGGKKSTSTTGVSITISPTTASIAGGATQQFTATVTGSTNTTVTWQVNGTTGGDAINGTISTTGLYTAPTKLPTTTSVTVTAISQADTTKTAVAVVTLTAPAVTITVSPQAPTVLAGGTVQFTATVSVTGSTNNAVTWSVNGDAVHHGTIDANGLYTAPASPAPQSGITVTATSQANTAFSASVPVTVQFSKASLNGTYVFLAVRGDGASGTGFAYRGGTFVADGKGNITSGVSDSSSVNGAFSNLAFTGTGSYSVGVDGRGTLTFSDSSGTQTFSFALTSNTRGQLIQFDSGPVTSGFIRLQDQTAIAGISGPFVFGFTGVDASGGPSAAVGQISFSTSGNLITGTEDLSVVGSVSPGISLPGSFLLGPGGRGTATINTSSFVFYIINTSTLIMIDVSSTGPHLAGTAYAQSGTFSSTTLGSSVFVVSGNRSSDKKPYGLAARFDTNAGSFSGGAFDTNSAGTVVTNSAFSSNASYTVAANGRGTMMTIGASGTVGFIFWLASPQLGVILENDTSSNPVASGLLLQQQQSGFTSLTGGFAFVTSGFDPTGATALANDGQFASSGTAVSGALDLNSGGTLTSGSTFANGLLSINANATGTIGISSSALSAHYNLYFGSANRFLMLSTDANSPVLSGTGERQCSDCTF